MKSRKVLAFITSLIFCNSFLVTSQVADVISNSITTHAEEINYSGSCGENCTYSFDETTGTLTINGTGSMENYTSSTKVPWHSYKDTIKKVIIQDGVTSIGDDAFSDCASLESITISNSVISIGNYAFLECTELKIITIPNSITSIGDGAFGCCTSLESVTIPKSVTSIGDGVFCVCSSLESVTFQEDSKLISISYCMFACCTSLTDITIPNSITSISDGAFGDCTSLESITIPKSVTFIDEGAFISCSNLKNVYFQGTLKEWEKIDIKNNNTSLTNATIHYLGDSEIPITTEPIIDTSNPKINPTDSLIYISNGDFNRDGQTNVLDYISFKNKLLNNSEYPQEYDINGDEIVNIKDLFLLKRQILNSMPIYRMISDNTVQLKGIANNTKNISKIQCDWYPSHTPDKINSVDIEVHNDDFWYTDVFEISSGNNCVNITYTYKDGSIKNETYILQKVTDEIVLNYNVKLINPDTITGMNRINSIYDSIIDMYVDTMQTDDVSDDETILIVTKDSPLLGSISTGEISQDDIIYIPSCDKFINGLSLIYVSQDSNYDASTYGSDYVAIHTKQASIVDVISNEDNQDIFISYDSIDVDSISWIPYEYDDNIINQYYNPNYVQEASAFSLDFQNVQQSMGFHLATTPNESKIPKAENKNLKKGWNLNNFIHSIYIDKSYYGGSSLQDVLSSLEIVIGNNEAVIYDGDGDVQTTNDQLKGSVEFSIDNVKPSIVLETHNGTLGATYLDQFMCKLNYDKSFKVNINGEAEVSLSDVFGDDNEDNAISLAKKEKKKAIELTGLDLSDKFILGMISMDITGQIDTTYMTSSDEVASVKPKVFIMLYMDLNGEISASLSLDYNYKSTETFGFNLQNKKYNGKYGSYDKNKSNNENNNYSVGDYGLTFYDGSDSKTLINNFNGEVSAELHTSMGANLGVGVSLLNIIPVLGHVGVKFDGNFSGTGSITYDAVNKENTSADITGNMNVSANFNAGVDCYLGVKAWFIDKEFKKNIYTEAPIFDMGFVTYNGTITSSADGSPVPNATITLTSNGNTFTTTTDDNGEFDMKPPIIYSHIFSDGTYTLKVSADNFDDYIDNNYLISGANSYNDINFELNPKEFSLSGATCDENTNPISDVDVTISTTDNKVIASAITDSDGKFKISLNETTTDGKYLVSFSKQGFETTTKEITIDGVTSIGNVTLISNISIDDNTDHGEVTASGTCGDNVNWNLYEDDTLIIDGNGDMYINYSAPWEDYKLSIKKVIIKYGVTSIGYRAFDGCKTLNSVTIADSVTNIPNCAFWDCISLKSIEIPSSVISIGSSFMGCTSLSNVKLNEGLETIGGSAFSGCKSLKNIKLPNSLTKIENWAFHGTSLESVTIPKNVTSVEDAFDGLTTLKSVTVNGSGLEGSGYDGVFQGCTSLTEVILNEGVTGIGRLAFSGCSSLESIIIPNTVTEIGDLAFEDCELLHNVTIGNGVLSINYGAFLDCKSLESIIIPNNVTAIHFDVFKRCTKLSNVQLGNKLVSIGSSAFENCSSLKNIVIPSNVTEICESAFKDCILLTNITLNEGLVSIGNDAFANCSLLTNIDIPNTVTTIDGYAFSGCTSLTSIVIPDNVVEVGYSAFSGCTSLSDVKLSNSMTEIKSEMFYGCTSLSNINIPSNILLIGYKAFRETSLTSVTIPSSVNSIATYGYPFETTVVIYSESGSYAETWANEQGYTFVAI